MNIEIDKKPCMKDLWYRGEYIENDIITKFEIFNPEVGDTIVIWEDDIIFENRIIKSNTEEQILKQFFEQ